MIPDLLPTAMRCFHWSTAGRDSGAIPRFKAAFPDVTATIQQVFAEGSKVMVHVLINGTHEGEWMGMAATHQTMTWTASSIIRFNSASKMVERWVIEDEGGVLQQLGRIPRFQARANDPSPPARMRR